LEPHGKPEAPDARGSVNTSNHPTSSFSELADIEETITRGAITIGVVPPLKECVAIAHEGRHTLTMLKRQKGESLTELLSRLNLAIARAHTDDTFTDEINPANTKHP
jgi:hypothetical protein